MNGTSRDAHLAMRPMPPMMTAPTTSAMTTPMPKRSHAVLSMPMGVVKTVVTDSTSWLACMKHNVPTSPKMLNATASHRQLAPRPCVMMYMGPPCGLPCSSLPLYMMLNAPSKNLVVMPSSALTHIQKMTPGPPTDSAMATPAILPMPTVAAMALSNACTELICPACLPVSEACLSRSARSPCGRCLMEMPRDRTNRMSPPPMSSRNSGRPQMASLRSATHWPNASLVAFMSVV